MILDFSWKKREKFLVIKKKYFSGNKHFGLFQKILLNIKRFIRKNEHRLFILSK